MPTVDHTPFVGTSAIASELRLSIARVAQTDSKVLISGESGTGKEIIARHIHAASRRAARPFVTVNCGGLAESLLESELFGHVRGSFTGAYRDKQGKLEIADTGTIVLDEIGETTPRMQALLLRLLETGEIQKVGADDQTLRVDVRTIAATHRNLRDMVARGLFREDLYYRLNVIKLTVPPLRERAEDVPALVGYFLERLRPANAPAPMAIVPEALAMLTAYSWPGNVRELQNVIERLVVQGRSRTITVEDLPPEVRPAWKSSPFVERRRSIADDLYRRMTEEGQGFWTTIYPLFMRRDISREVMLDIVRRGLVDARGNYKVVVRLFNIPPADYKKFMNFLRKHQCQPPFKDFRR